MSKRIFKTAEQGTRYELPIWTVVDGQGIKEVPNIMQVVTFVRGSKRGEDEVEKVNGILHETLLSMMIEDMKYKNSLIPSRESSTAITKLQEALFWMEERQRDRESREVVGTYQK